MKYFIKEYKNRKLIPNSNVLGEKVRKKKNKEEMNEKEERRKGFRMTPIVIVPHGMTTRLAKHFGITIQAVRNALKYQCNSPQAQAVRREAVQNYGGTETKVRVQA